MCCAPVLACTLPYSPPSIRLAAALYSAVLYCTVLYSAVSIPGQLAGADRPSSRSTTPCPATEGRLIRAPLRSEHGLCWLRKATVLYCTYYARPHAPAPIHPLRTNARHTSSSLSPSTQQTPSLTHQPTKPATPATPAARRRGAGITFLLPRPHAHPCTARRQRISCAGVWPPRWTALAAGWDGWVGGWDRCFVDHRMCKYCIGRQAW